jgi:hypothetical protein
MKPDAVLKLVQKWVRSVVQPALETHSGRMNPDEKARDIDAGLTEEQRKEYAKIQKWGRLALITADVRDQTRSKPEHDQQGDLFSDWYLKSWMPSAVSDDRLKVEDAVWPDHEEKRERQIGTMLISNRRFEREELRRKKLREAGMAADPKMTTAVALKKMKGT